HTRWPRDWSSDVCSSDLEVWIIRPSGPPRSLVVFVHGLGEGETTPVNHRPWLEHLALEGSAVIYPRYERTLGSAGAVRHIVTGRSEEHTSELQSRGHLVC